MCNVAKEDGGSEHQTNSSEIHYNKRCELVHGGKFEEDADAGIGSEEFEENVFLAPPQRLPSNDGENDAEPANALLPLCRSN